MYFKILLIKYLHEFLDGNTIFFIWGFVSFLIMHVLSSIAIHILNEISPLKQVIQEIERIFSKFLRGKFEQEDIRHWIA